MSEKAAKKKKVETYGSYVPNLYKSDTSVTKSPR
jgi:hypothetical protein